MNSTCKTINLFMPNGLFSLFDRFISNLRDVCIFFITIFELIVNIVDPDQTPRSVVCDLGLHSLPVSISWDASHQYVNAFCCCCFLLLF